MEKRRLGSVVAVSVCFLFAFCSIAWAGIEPVPWKPEINKLNALENGLHSIHERVKRVLAIPPDPWTPSPNVNGAVGRLSAMNNQLILLNHMLASVMDEVLAIPPDPWVPTDLLPALEGVRAASQGIGDSINAYLSLPPDPWVPALFISALTNLGIASQNIANDAVQYIMSGEGCLPEIWCGCVGTVKPCNEITTPIECTKQKGCYWSTEPDGGCLGTSNVCSEFLTATTCVNQAGCHVGTCVDGICQ